MVPLQWEQVDQTDGGDTKMGTSWVAKERIVTNSDGDQGCSILVWGPQFDSDLHFSFLSEGFGQLRELWELKKWTKTVSFEGMEKKWAWTTSRPFLLQLIVLPIHPTLPGALKVNSHA